MKNVMETLKSMMGEGRKKAGESAPEKKDAAPEERIAADPEETGAPAPEEEERPVKTEEESEPETLTVRGGYNPEPEAPSQKNALRARVQEYLKEHRLVYQVAEDSDRLFHTSLNIRLQGRMNTCRMIILATESDIESIAVSPIAVAEEYRAATAEFMMRANYGLKLGAFELDFRDGEVRFKSTLSAVSGVPSAGDVSRVVSMPVIMFERFGEGLVKCMMGLGNPEEEIRKILEK